MKTAVSTEQLEKRTLSRFAHDDDDEYLFIFKIQQTSHSYINYYRFHSFTQTKNCLWIKLVEFCLSLSNIIHSFARALRGIRTCVCLYLCWMYHFFPLLLLFLYRNEIFEWNWVWDLWWEDEDGLTFSPFPYSYVWSLLMFLSSGNWMVGMNSSAFTNANRIHICIKRRVRWVRSVWTNFSLKIIK